MNEIEGAITVVSGSEIEEKQMISRVMESDDCQRFLFLKNREIGILRIFRRTEEITTL